MGLLPKPLLVVTDTAGPPRSRHCKDIGPPLLRQLTSLAPAPEQAPYLAAFVANLCTTKPSPTAARVESRTGSPLSVSVRPSAVSALYGNNSASSISRRSAAPRASYISKSWLFDKQPAALETTG